MVTDEHHLLATHNERNHTFYRESVIEPPSECSHVLTWLGGLRRFVNKNGAEFDLGQARIATANAGCTDHVCSGQNLLLAYPFEALVFSFIALAEFSLLVLQLYQLLQLNMSGVIRDLTVESQERNRRCQGFA